MAKMTDCIGKFIKVCPCSITIKNDFGKTCGVVRDIVTLYDAQPKHQFEYDSKLKKGGLVQCEIMENIHRIIIKDKELYYLYNINGRERYEKLCPEDVERDDALVEKFRKAGVSVIECIICK